MEAQSPSRHSSGRAHIPAEKEKVGKEKERQGEKYIYRRAEQKLYGFILRLTNKEIL